VHRSEPHGGACTAARNCAAGMTRTQVYGPEKKMIESNIYEQSALIGE
jgi:hypothetical protein